MFTRSRCTSSNMLTSGPPGRDGTTLNSGAPEKSRDVADTQVLHNICMLMHVYPAGLNSDLCGCRNLELLSHDRQQEIESLVDLR